MTALGRRLVLCPRCGARVSRGGGPPPRAVLEHAPIVGTLLHARTTFSCPECGPLPTEELPREVQRAIVLRQWLYFLVAVGGAIGAVALAIALGAR